MLGCTYLVKSAARNPAQVITKVCGEPFSLGVVVRTSRGTFPGVKRSKKAEKFARSLGFSQEDVSCIALPKSEILAIYPLIWTLYKDHESLDHGAIVSR